MNVARFLNASYLATGGDDNLVRIWDARRLTDTSGRPAPVRTLRGHADWIKNAEPVPGTGLLLSCGFDRSVLCWDVAQFSSCGGSVADPWTCSNEVETDPWTITATCSAIDKVSLGHGHVSSEGPESALDESSLPSFSREHFHQDDEDGHDETDEASDHVVYLKGIATEEQLSRPRYGINVPVMRMAVSPDGRRMAFCTFRPFVYVVHDLDATRLPRDFEGVAFDDIAEATRRCRHAQVRLCLYILLCSRQA